MDNNIDKWIAELQSCINKTYKTTIQGFGENIFRGHTRSISTDIEDGIAKFVRNFYPDCKIFIDPSITVSGKTHRPDLLVVDPEAGVVAMLEIKANMGWCRNAAGVIDKIVANNEIFKGAKTLQCKFSNADSEDNKKLREQDKIVTYGDNVKCFLISLTDANCKAGDHEHNKQIAKENNVWYFTLFTGWYNNLSNAEIKEFAKALKKD